MTDLEKKPWWQSLVTIPNLIVVVTFLVGVGGWLRDSERVRERLTTLEQRLDTQQETFERRVTQERQNSEMNYMRRDVLIEQLRTIDVRLGRIEKNLR